MKHLPFHSVKNTYICIYIYLFKIKAQAFRTKSITSKNQYKK